MITMQGRGPNDRTGDSAVDQGWTVYTSDMRSRAGIFEAWTRLLRDLLNSRFLIWQLFLKDFKAQYQQSVLGIVWSVIMPLIPVLIYLFMSAIGVLLPGDTRIPYVLFVFVGLSVWKIFSDGISFAMSKLLESKAMLGKIRVPKIAIICSSLGRVFFETLVRSLLIVLAMLWCGLAPSALGVVLLLPALIPLLCVTLGIAMLASLVNVVIRDVQKLVDVALTYAMFVSSVIFMMPDEALIGTVNSLNFMNTFVNGIRETLFLGIPSKPGLFLLTSSLSVLFLFAVGRLFYIMEHVIDDKL
ncbi:MAG: ABC transporter permease [Desulfomonile tiedjei]|nr:ABC transporter permease [Desulfomonile tiedjei]